MNKQKSSKKPWLILLVIVIIGVIIYFYVQGTAPTDSSALSATENTDVSAQVITLLNQIQSLRIDTSLFKDPAYATLRDYSVIIPPENVGRVNPFAPIPGFIPIKH